MAPIRISPPKTEMRTIAQVGKLSSSLLFGFGDGGGYGEATT
jgi:hypothetical protein